jgi:hypothetical protein
MANFICPNCRQTLSATAEQTGKTARCPCGAILRIPAVKQASAPPLPATISVGAANSFEFAAGEPTKKKTTSDPITPELTLDQPRSRRSAKSDAPFWKRPVGIYLLVCAILGTALIVAIIAIVLPRSIRDGDQAQLVPAERAPPQAAPKAAAKRELIPRSLFRLTCQGGWPDKILERFGPPDSTEGNGFGEVWYYRNRTYDPITNKRDKVAIIQFDHNNYGIGKAVQFIGGD